MRSKQISDFWEFTILFFLTLIVFNGIQSLNGMLKGFHTRLYAVAHAFALLSLVYGVFNSFYSKGVLSKMMGKFRSLDIPRAAKGVVLVIFLGNFISIAVGEPLYPFYDVGMFRWTTKFENKSKLIERPKYFYYNSNGQVQIFDVRKQGFYLLADHLKGIRYTHEFTFAATYHNRGSKSNFEFLQYALDRVGGDSLWVGVHWVNFETQQTGFDPDLCRAVLLNASNGLYYGSIYIPEYQLKQCE